jgi:hypothetical protein
VITTLARMVTETELARRLPTIPRGLWSRDARQTKRIGNNSTRIVRHRSFIKLIFIKNFCSSCKTLADQATRNPMYHCILAIKKHERGIYSNVTD